MKFLAVVVGICLAVTFPIHTVALIAVGWAFVKVANS
jgi:hypothetical protein